MEFIVKALVFFAGGVIVCSIRWLLYALKITSSQPEFLQSCGIGAAIGFIASLFA